MRTLIRRRDDLHDPAPSRLAYRLERLRLTPAVRILFRLGLPLAAAVASAALVLSDAGRREALGQWVAEIRASVEERPEFMVTSMTVDGVSPSVEAAVRRSAPVAFPISSFDLDLPELQTAIAALPAVERVDLRIRPGGILDVRVVERVPVAVWRVAGGLMLLDRQGNRVAQLDQRTDRIDLPLLAGAGADRAVPEALALLAAARPLDARMRGLVRMGERRWDVVLDGDQTILLPETAPVPALEQVLALNQAQDILDRDVVAIDMRNPRRPTVRLGDTAIAGLKHVSQKKLGAPPE
ncbi:MAG: cell division protein FtsQ/DivIB [Tranquillimonas sp.]